MNLGEKLQAAEVAIGAIGLLITSIGTCIAWHTVKGIPTCNVLPIMHQQLTNHYIVQLRQWEQHLHALPMHNQQAQQPAVDHRRATIPASKVRCLFAFAKHIIVAAGFMS
jgi:hypothetical protein